MRYSRLSVGDQRTASTNAGLFFIVYAKAVKAVHTASISVKEKGKEKTFAPCHRSTGSPRNGLGLRLTRKGRQGHGHPTREILGTTPLAGDDFDKSFSKDGRFVLRVATLGGSLPPASLTTSSESVKEAHSGTSRTSNRFVTRATTANLAAKDTADGVWGRQNQRRFNRRPWESQRKNTVKTPKGDANEKHIRMGVVFDRGGHLD